MTVEDQPAPKATDRKPMWPAVIDYIEHNYDNAEGQTTVSDLIADMQARDKIGRERYGVPLTSKNGRDAMVDAYQELLDYVVYVRTWLDEQGIEPLAPEIAEPTDERPSATIDGKIAHRGLDDRERMMLTMYTASVEMLLQMRGALK